MRSNLDPVSPEAYDLAAALAELPLYKAALLLQKLLTERDNLRSALEIAADVIAEQEKRTL